MSLFNKPLYSLHSNKKNQKGKDLLLHTRHHFSLKPAFTSNPPTHVYSNCNPKVQAPRRKYYTRNLFVQREDSLHHIFLSLLHIFLFPQERGIRRSYLSAFFFLLKKKNVSHQIIVIWVAWKMRIFFLLVAKSSCYQAHPWSRTPVLKRKRTHL